MRNSLKIMKTVSISSMILLAMFLTACGGGGGGGAGSGETTTGDGIVHGTAYFPFYPTYAELDNEWRLCMHNCAQIARGDYVDCIAECEKYQTDPWNWKPDYYEDVNEYIGVYLHDSDGTIIKDAFTEKDGYFEFTELGDAYYYLSAYCEEPNELEPDEQVDVFEAETDLFEVGSTMVKNVHLEYVETVTETDTDLAVDYVPSGCEQHGGHLVKLLATSPTHGAVCGVYVDGQLMDSGNPASYGSFEYGKDIPYPSDTELRLEVSGGEFMTPGSEICVWCPGEDSYCLWP